MSEWAKAYSEADKIPIVEPIQTEELLKTTSLDVENYTKPHILFVNGHWTIFAKVPNAVGIKKANLGPSTGGKNYWSGGPDNGSSNNEVYFNEAIQYFTNSSSYNVMIGYPDGSSMFGFDRSGQGGVDAGYAYANENLDILTSSSPSGYSVNFYILGHSEGGPFSVGIANLLKEKGHNVKEILLLSCDEADEFSINQDFYSYQLFLSYYKEKYGFPGKYEIQLDPVVHDFKLDGITKVCVAQGNYSFWTVHGTTAYAGNQIFNKVKDLKTVTYTLHTNPIGFIFYTQSVTPYNTLFYSIDRIFIAENHPNWDPNTQTIYDE